MRRMRIGAGILLALLAVSAEARATFGGAGFGGGAPAPGGAGQSRPAAAGGMTGFAGACGPSGFAGMSGFSGCFGGPNMCGFSGCLGGPYCYGSMSGCFGSFAVATQTYSKWAPSPGKAYYHRTLTIQMPPPNEAILEFVLVHYPDRPKFFYYYDPVEKKYFGRYRTGATPTDCFHVLGFADRKPSLKDIKDSAFRSTGGMPIMKYVLQPKSGVSVDAALQNLKLLRPPESIPDELLGLPPEEPALKKMPEKK